jgi:type III secretion system TyeA family effector delivery regulator
MGSQLPPDIDEQVLLLALLKLLSDGWISPTHFDRLLSELRVPDGAPAIFFLTGIQQILRELPFKVFQDDHSREAIIDAAQAALDQAIAREEALLRTETNNDSQIELGKPS